MSQLILILSVGLFCILGASGLTTVVNGGQVVITTTVEVPNLRVRITGETTGYVGFGISPEGTMAGADIVLGGYDDVTKLPYGKDYTATGNTRPQEDLIQNVEIVSASQNETHTTLEFLRPLESEDLNQDLPITNGSLNVIYALGSGDSVAYHNSNRGLVLVDILGGDESNLNEN